MLNPGGQLTSAVPAETSWLKEMMEAVKTMVKGVQTAGQDQAMTLMEAVKTLAKAVQTAGQDQAVTLWWEPDLCQT